MSYMASEENNATNSEKTSRSLARICNLRNVTEVFNLAFSNADLILVDEWQDETWKVIIFQPHLQWQHAEKTL